MSKGTVTLHPVELTVADAEGNNETTFVAWEGPVRIDADELPDGWHRYAVRDCGGEGETLEKRVIVDHMNDYVTRIDLDPLMERSGGWLDVIGCGGTKDAEPIDLPAAIDHYR